MSRFAPHTLSRLGLAMAAGLFAPTAFAAAAAIPAAHVHDEASLQAIAMLPSLTLSKAVNAAIAGNPDLKQFAFQLKAQSARIDGAGLKPAPVFESQLENFLGTGRTRGLDAAEATFALSQLIELGEQRASRIEAARLGIDGINLNRQGAQLDVLAEVSRQFIHVASDQEQLKLTQLATKLAERTVSEVRRRVAAAKSPEVELHRANIVFSRAQVDEEHAEHELITSRTKLAALWGAGKADFGLVAADLFRLPQVGDYGVLTRQLVASPDFLRFATEARQRDADIRVAQSKVRSNITVSAGVRRLQEDGDAAFVAGFSAPLFGARTAQPAIAEARALRAGIESEAAAAKLKAETKLFELVQELKHSITEAEMLRDSVLPQMEEALKETEYAYQRGRYSYLEWVDAQRERVTVQRALIEAAANAHLFSAEIERLTGTALPTAGSSTPNNSNSK
ncbi:MAG: TolC family protein [Stagnimonas sp.]|nr:TolC family protein [Stagnimonas sp.]